MEIAINGMGYWTGVKTRLLDLAPESYDAANRTVDAVLSRGSPVPRFYGTEQLEISKAAINISRLESSGIPLLDSHRQDGINNVLGKVVRAWISGGALLGTLAFAATEQGEKAEAMVSRGEISSISIGYRVEPESWEIRDGKGNIVDPGSSRWNDTDLTFTAKRWELLEASLVSVGADSSAVMRSNAVDRELHSAAPPKHVEETLARMQARHAIATGVSLLATDTGHHASTSAALSIFDRQRRDTDARPPRLIFYG